MRQILMMYLLVRSQQQPKLASPVQDLKSQSFTLSSWTLSSTSYTTTFTQCNQLLMKLISSTNYYQKTITIKDYEYNQVFIELDVYFIQFTPASIQILANSQIIYQQSFTNVNIKQNTVCSSSQDYQQTIFANFYTSSSSINIQIKYLQTTSNSNSFLGIKNLNVYTNGISLINNCKMSAPLYQGSSCVSQCTVANPYLKGITFTQCAASSNTNSALLAYIYWTDSNSWIYKGTNPISSYLQTCQSTLQCLISNGTYTNVFTNSYMTSQFQQSRLIALKVTMRLASDYIQVVFIFYLFGQWNDGSYVALFVNGPTNLQSNIVTIYKQMGQYYSSTGSQISSTNLTNNNNGSIIQAQKTQIVFSACFQSASYSFEWTQYLSGNDAAYGFGDFSYYFAINVPSCSIYGITGICVVCSGGNFAYNGVCQSSCPPYSIQQTGNCTDYSQTESQIYSASININGFGQYIMRDFYDYRFESEYIKSLFTFQPPEYKNYYNSHAFSFVDSTKILGGFNSWGYGSYTKIFQNLLDHYQLRIYCTLYLLDDWQSGDTFQILVDGLIVFSTQQTQSSQLAGLSANDQQQTISLKIAHTSLNLKLEFRCTLANQDPSLSSCGIQNLFVLIDQNIKILCPSANTYFSYYTKQCETCYRTNCFLYPMKQPIICSMGCLACSSSTVCTSCDTIHGYTLSGNQCICSSGYILNNGQCVNCYYSCKTCSGIQDYQCTNMCETTRTLANGKCVCNSPLVDVGIQQCQAIIQQNPSLTTCNYRCQTCYGTLYNQCLSCSAGNNRVYNPDEFTCYCISGYIESGIPYCASGVGQTYSCDNTCLTCYGPSNDNCITCDSNKNRQLSGTKCECLSGFAQSQITDPYCYYQSCDYTCQTCSGPNNNDCLSCVNTRQLLVDQCPCLSNYVEYQQQCYQILSSGCHYSCATCINNLVNGCVTCPNSAYRQYTSFTCICQTYYIDQGVQVCAPNYSCNYACQTCEPTNSNFCYSCKANSNRQLTNDQCPCQTGYIEYQSNVNCLQILNIGCHYSCLTCINNSDNGCVTCSSSSHRSYQQQTWTCPCDQYYIDDSVSFCKQNYVCDYTCLTCNPLILNQCTTCDQNSNRAFVNDTCVCDSGYIDYNQSLICLQIVSVNCHYSCQTCVNNLIDGCVTCPASSQRTYNQINWTCPCDNNYTDNGTSICIAVQSCNFSCLTCNPANGMSCYSCPTNSFRQLINNKCICQDEYYDLGLQVCAQIQQYCHPRCLTCFGSTDQQCITCDNTRTLTINGLSQECICNLGYQELSITYKCILQIQSNLCYPLCLTCFGISQNECFNCINDNNVQLQNQSTCKCKDNYNNIQNNSLCQINANTCHYSCNTCYQDNSSDTCLSCRQSDLRTLKQNECQCISHYYDAGYQICQSCHYSCYECSDQNKFSCLSCDSQNSLRILNNNQCTCQPNSSDVGQFNCQRIQCNIPGCLVCTDVSVCSVCNKQNSFELQGQICKCSSGYYMDYQTCLSCQKYQNWLNPECTKIDCTDNIFMNGEECDDGNKNQRDGCDNCKLQNGYMCQNVVGYPSQCFKCGDNCDECDNKLACLKCSSQYNLMDSFCVKCPSNCNKCINNKCVDCIRKYSNLPKNNKQCPMCSDFDGYYNGQNECFSKCGDGYTVLQEKCDDGNTMNYDGCSSTCQIEDGYNCVGNVCFKLDQPRMVSYQLQKEKNQIYFSQRFVVLNFTKFINCPNSLYQHFNFQINQVDQSLYQIVPQEYILDQFNLYYCNYSLYVIINLLDTLDDIQLFIQLENVTIADSDGLQLKSYVTNTSLDNYVFVNLAVEQTTQIFSDFNSYLLYFLLILVILAILIGGIDIFWNLLDLLQLLSYTLFIDTQYPYNLQTFLNLFKFGQLQFLSNLIYIQSFINFLTDAPSIPQQKPKGKFALQYSDTLFFNNISSVVTTFIIAYLIYLFYQSVIWSGQQVSLRISFKASIHSNPNFYLNLMKFKSRILNFVKEYSETFLFSGLIRVHMSTTYDLTFAILLSYQNSYEKNSILHASYQIANICLSIHIAFIFIYLYIINLSQFTLQTQKYQNNYGKALFSGINDQKQINLYYNVFLIFKRTTHIFIINLLYSVPQLQTLCLGCLGLSNIIYLFVFEPLDQKYEKYKQIQCEILLFLMHSQLFLLTMDDIIGLFSILGRQNIGWICIIEITLVIVVQIIFDVAQQSQYILKKYQFIRNIISNLFKKQRQGSQQLFD